MSKKLLAILVVIVALGAGAAWYLLRPTPDAVLANNADTSTASSTAASTNGLPADSIGPKEHVMGSATAPITMIEYFSQGCSVCSRFDQDVFPLLKAKYIDTGKVRYVMRLFPLFSIDGPAYKLDMCVPPENFFASVDLLFRNQSQWDSAEFPGVTDSHAGLIKLARIMGLSAEQADACMNATTLDAAINKNAQDANTRYTIDGTPTFVIEYKKVDLGSKSWAEAQTAIDAALKAKGAK